MDIQETNNNTRSLHSLANTQGGYFTAKQATELGYKRPNIAYHISAGNFERVGHGLYRVKTIPVHEHDDLIKIYLWSRDRNDKPQGVFSHMTALALLNLSEIIPSTVHLSVPALFQKKAPQNCKLHRTKLEQSDIQEFGEFKITKPIKTLLDCARKGSVPREQILKAIDQAIAQGIVIKSDLLSRAKKHQALTWITTHIKDKE